MSTHIVVLVARTAPARGAPLVVFFVERGGSSSALDVNLVSVFAALRDAVPAPLRESGIASTRGFAVDVGRAGGRLFALARAFRSACRAAFLAVFFAAFAARASFSLLRNLPFFPLGSREIAGGRTTAAGFVSPGTETAANVVMAAVWAGPRGFSLGCEATGFAAIAAGATCAAGLASVARCSIGFAVVTASFASAGFASVGPVSIAGFFSRGFAVASGRPGVGGFASIGLASAGFAAAGFVATASAASAGLASIGLASTGLASTGLASIARAVIGATAAAGVGRGGTDGAALGGMLGGTPTPPLSGARVGTGPHALVGAGAVDTGRGGAAGATLAGRGAVDIGATLAGRGAGSAAGFAVLAGLAPRVETGCEAAGATEEGALTALAFGAAGRGSRARVGATSGARAVDSGSSSQPSSMLVSSDGGFDSVTGPAEIESKTSSCASPRRLFFARFL
jgi:hypothetical protein